jgi:hypothetical protein
MTPELAYWCSRVEHRQREMAAYGTALTGLEAATGCSAWTVPAPG